jgi:hypothetical protein
MHITPGDARQRFAGLVLLGSLMASSVANANDIFVSETGIAAGQASGSLDLPVGTNNFWSGFQTISVAATINGASANSFLAYCIDPAHYSSSAYTAFYAPSPEHNLATVFTSRAQTIQNLFNNYYAGTIGNNANAAAFQLALWEVADDDSNLATGSVRINSSTNPGLVSNAVTLLDNLSYSGPNLYDLIVYQVDRSVAGLSGQDYIVASPSAVPEPEPYGLILSGLVAMAVIPRRRYK